MAKKMSLPFKGTPQHSQGFGARPSVYERFGLRGHDGDDWLMEIGTPLFAPFTGEIKKHGNAPNSWGIYQWVWDPGQRLIVNIAHQNALQVTTGARGEKGQQIGFSGNTGFSEAPHVHVAAADTDLSAEARLAHAKDLHDKGLIDADEYAAVKERILAEL